VRLPGLFGRRATPQHDSGIPCEPTGAPSALPKGFAPVLAKRCVLVEPTPTDDVHWVREEQVAHGGFDALLRALRLPSEPRQPLPCPSPVPIGVTLVDAHGTAVVPAPPEDFCGRPLAEVRGAVDAMPWETVSRTTVPRS